MDGNKINVVDVDVGVMLARLEQIWGHTDFREKQFSGSEYDYKYELSRRTRELLAREALHRLIEEENWFEICRRVVDSFKHRYSLARWDEYRWVRELDAQEQQQIGLLLYQFLYGEEPFLDRLEKFVADATAVYFAFRERDPKHQKNYTRQSLAWPFVSYFHFMMWPDQEYAFIKPSYLWEAAELANFNLHYQSWPNRETYASVQEFYRALWPTVQRLGGRDWIDVQTLIYVAGGGYGVPQGGWVDDKKPDPWAEQIARWQSEHLPFERIAARQDAEQKARNLLSDKLGHFNLETLDEFLALLNVDYFKGQMKNNRFGQAFCGANRNLIAQNLDDFNLWSTRLWETAEVDLSNALTEYWREKAVPGGGRSLPTMILYLRDPSRYSVWFHSLMPGLEQIINKQMVDERSGLAYQVFNNGAQEMRERYGLEPQEVDVILTLASGVGKKPEEKRISVPPPPPSLRSILEHITASPYVFSDAIVTNYHLSLLTKPFVILTGLSGTGKTKLTRLYADAVYGIEEKQPNPYYAIVAVRPDWTDNRGLLGYYNPLTRAYEVTPFLRFMLKAAADPENWYYFCLDEMNLARVEYYFSDFLSAMESNEPIALHSQEGYVASQAGEDIVETLPVADIPWDYVADGVLYVPPSLPIPPNLALSGTVNVDETTHAFSDKVLDRANSIEFNRTDLDRFAERYRARFPDRASLVDEVLPLLHQIYGLLEPHYLHFGYRTMEEVLGYLWQNETLPEDVRRDQIEVLDNQLMQKVLPKLRGDERIGKALEDLRDVLKNALGDDSQSVEKLNWMLKELTAFGSTQFWR